MSVTVEILDSDASYTFELCSASAFAEFSAWVAPLPYAHLTEFVEDGSTVDTMQFAEELKQALEVHECSENVREIAEELLARVGVGDSEESISVVE